MKMLLIAAALALVTNAVFADHHEETKKTIKHDIEHHHVEEGSDHEHDDKHHKDHNHNEHHPKHNEEAKDHGHDENHKHVNTAKDHEHEAAHHPVKEEAVTKKKEVRSVLMGPFWAPFFLRKYESV